MKRSKKFLSVILAVLMAFSSLTVGFYAIAAETAESGDAEEKSAVTEAQDAITKFYDNKYHTLMFSAKEEEAEQKAEALKAYDALCTQLKALTDAEKLELNLSNYMYVLALITDKVGRDEGLSSNNAKVYGATTGYDKVVEKVGALPAEYQAAYDAVKALYVKVDGTLFNSSFDFKAHNEGYAHFDACMDQVKKLSHTAITFANYASPYGDAFYFNALNPTSTASYFTSNTLSWAYNYCQDSMIETGKDPSISYSTFMDRKRVDGVYQCSWKADYDAVSYKAAYENYVEQFKTDVVEVSKAAFAKLLDIYSAIYGEDVKNVGEFVLEKGLQYYNSGSITVAECQEVLDKMASVTGPAESILITLIGHRNFRITSDVIYPENFEFTADKTAQEVYDNQISVKTQTIANFVQSMRDVLTQLQMEEFENAVNAVDFSKLDDETIENIRALYAAIPSNFQSKIDNDVLAKFMQIVKPAADDYDFEKEISAFKTIPVNRADIGNINIGGQYIARNIIWTEEGIQNSVDGTYKLVKTVLNTANIQINGKKLDLTNGLNDLLKDNVYQASVVNAIFDLYAMLSHNETETGVSLAPTLGDVIKMLISKSGITSRLAQDDNKYASAIAKINALPAVTDEEKAEGINDLDKIAEIEFTDADFGFKNGDKDGFIDALLAALRPLTYMLAGDSTILGIAGVKIKMFDSVDAKGEYGEDGIYAMLLPLLEQVGLTDLPTPIEYRTNYYTVRETMGKNLGYDEVLRPVINSLFKNVVQPVADKPLDGIIALLPRIAYVINTNMVNDTVKDVIVSTGDTLAGLAGGLDLSAKAINNMISGVVINLDENTSIRLKPINWHILADCATVEAVPSHSNANEYVMLRTGDVDSCFSTVFFYIHSIIFADKANYDALRAFLGSVITDKILFSTITGITDKLAVGDRNAAFAQFLALTGNAGDTAIPITKADAQKQFVDLAGFEKYDDYIAYTSVYNEFVRGTNPPTNNVYSPVRTIERAMMITILYRLAGEPYKDGNPHEKTPFTDITDTNAYYYDAACWALDLGITTETTFKPFNAVSRQETAAFLFRYAQIFDLIPNENYKESSIEGYHDYDTIRPWAVEPLQWANYNGMITGTEQGYANPEGVTYRVHASKILYGFGKNCDIGNFK